MTKPERHTIAESLGAAWALAEDGRATAAQVLAAMAPALALLNPPAGNDPPEPPRPPDPVPVESPPRVLLHGSKAPRPWRRKPVECVAGGWWPDLETASVALNVNRNYLKQACGGYGRGLGNRVRGIAVCYSAFRTRAEYDAAQAGRAA